MRSPFELLALQIIADVLPRLVSEYTETALGALDTHRSDVSSQNAIREFCDAELLRRMEVTIRQKFASATMPDFGGISMPPISAIDARNLGAMQLQMLKMMDISINHPGVRVDEDYLDRFLRDAPRPDISDIPNEMIPPFPGAREAILQSMQEGYQMGRMQACLAVRKTVRKEMEEMVEYAILNHLKVLNAREITYCERAFQAEKILDSNIQEIYKALRSLKSVQWMISKAEL